MATNLDNLERIAVAEELQSIVEYFVTTKTFTEKEKKFIRQCLSVAYNSGAVDALEDMDRNLDDIAKVSNDAS